MGRGKRDRQAKHRFGQIAERRAGRKARRSAHVTDREPELRASEIVAIDLFCGAGGLTCGLKNVGVDVRLGVDLDAICEYPYSENNKVEFLRMSVAELTGESLKRRFGDSPYKLLAGCAPCQPFSTYRQAHKPSDDERWNLLSEFGRLVFESGANLVTMENVPQLERESVFEDFVASLVKAGFEVRHQVVECVRYGVPQSRRRLVLLASKLGPIELLPPDVNAELAVRDVIGHLPSLSAGKADAEDPLHVSAGLSALNLSRIQASKPGGSWKDWPPSLVAKCHSKATGKTYPGVYGRMSWSEPSPTITTQYYGFGSGRFGHPEQDRALSLREGALLQSFPPGYRFVPSGAPVELKNIGRLIGNAVPVKLGEAIGKSLLHHVTSHARPR
jgi:DNA (cytosine-5)-methyltransferase 1